MIRWRVPWKHAARRPVDPVPPPRSKESGPATCDKNWTTRRSRDGHREGSSALRQSLLTKPFSRSRPPRILSPLLAFSLFLLLPSFSLPLSLFRFYFPPPPLCFNLFVYSASLFFYLSTSRHRRLPPHLNHALPEVIAPTHHANASLALRRDHFAKNISYVDIHCRERIHT